MKSYFFALAQTVVGVAVEAAEAYNGRGDCLARGRRFRTTTEETTVQCSHCGFVASEPGRFCSACGAQTGFAFPAQTPQTWPAAPQYPPFAYHAARARGFSQVFGIHPAIAFLTLIVDLMLFGGEVATLGAILPISIAAGGVLGVIAYLAQRKWYGDDKDSAAIKALIIGFLTAIPTPLPAILTVPSGIVGLIHNWRRK